MEANRLADAMGISPAYKQKETERWNNAMQTYQDMLASSGTQTPATVDEDASAGTLELSPVCSSNELLLDTSDLNKTSTPPNSPSMRRSSAILSSSSTKLTSSHSGRGLGESGGSTLVGGVSQYALSQPPSRGSCRIGNRSPPTLNPLSTMNRQASWAAGSTVTRDFIKYLDLHCRYFDSIYSLLDFVSPEYRKQFSNALTERLKAVEQQRANPQLRTSSSDPVLDGLMDMLSEQSIDNPKVRVQHPSGEANTNNVKPALNHFDFINDSAI